MKEIELKFAVRNTSEIKQKIKLLGWKFLKEEHQTDVYYTSLHKDFHYSQECLRIRTDSKGLIELTWKAPTTEEMLGKQQYWKEELNIDLNRDHYPLIKKLLLVLDFIPYAEVSKKRKVYQADSRTTVCIDHIIELGNFIEIETMSDSIEESVIKNFEIADRLSLPKEQIVSRPYRDLVYETFAKNAETA